MTENLFVVLYLVGMVLLLASLWGIAQALLVHNWISGLASLVIFIPVYLLRVPREERVMLNEFGDEYREYMKRTGRVLPRLCK